MTVKEIAEKAALDCREDEIDENFKVFHRLDDKQATARILRAFVEMLREEAAREEDVFSENAYNALADRIEKEIGV